MNFSKLKRIRINFKLSYMQINRCRGLKIIKWNPQFLAIARLFGTFKSLMHTAALIECLSSSETVKNSEFQNLLCSIKSCLVFFVICDRWEWRAWWRGVPRMTCWTSLAGLTPHGQRMRSSSVCSSTWVFFHSIIHFSYQLPPTTPSAPTMSRGNLLLYQIH